MKIFSHPPGEDWIVDRITQEFLKNTSHTITNLEDCDTIILFAPWCWNQYPQELLSTKKFIVVLHHIVPNKFNLNEFNTRDNFVDHYIVPNRHTYDFISQHTNKPVTLISYWINPSLWNNNPKKDSRKYIIELCKANKDKEFISTNVNLNNDFSNDFFIGSFQRDTEGFDLKTPKLEKGPDKFAECVKKIKKEKKLVLLGGWRRQYLISRFLEENINFIHIERPPIEIINIMYDSLDMYIVGSRHEGGPQAIIECGIKKIPIISTNVGIADAILHDDCILDVENSYIIPNENHVEVAFNNTLNVTINKQVEKIDLLMNDIRGT